MLNGFVLSCQLQQNLAADVEDELTQFGHKKKTMQCYNRQSAKRIDDENDTYYNNKKQNNN